MPVASGSAPARPVAWRWDGAGPAGTVAAMKRPLHHRIDAVRPVSLFRLYLLRAMYLLVVVGLGLVVWPGILKPPQPEALWESVTASMLGAFSLLCLLGLRYPLQMLPVLLWELLWKLIWLLTVALPLWQTGRMDAATWAITTQCFGVVLVPIVIPWRHVFDHYLRQAGDRWRRERPAP